ncbi:glycosyltransferase family 1 protein [Segetibacter sp. 3557_3]|uniref:glycosyltransferase family 4 protein n=1 Tax=Segetibacter sp. 3557_3 TaxID=2547429 RepID=UPI0010591E35|nr:glycosyltransferase family 1 protein [Segetibacter sp. 3557_3]TDH23324.1 glycosyltransferase family 1 protein [Segetibacter sp. 3557_3]
MKVLYDHQTFSLQDYGGISRIYTELLKFGPSHPEIKAELSILFSNNAYLEELRNVPYRHFLKRWDSYHKTRVMMVINRLYTIAKLKTTKVDIFHPTYYDPYFLPHLKGTPFVVTFLDLIHERFGNRYSQLADDKLMFGRKKIMLEHASKVIAISECTKKDIVEVFGTDPAKIEVIYLGNSLRVDRNNDIPALIKGDYLLFVGNRGTYKNFDFFLDATRELLVKNKELKIVCAGGGRFSPHELEKLRKLELTSQVVHVPVVNDNTLVSLYKNAVCFIFPSLYEGFGIPVLEAFSCGCPIVLSNRGSLPEVAGDAVLYCNPEDAHSIATQVTAYLDDAGLRTLKSGEGYKRLESFSWEKTSAETFALYKTIAR